jgi:hypothetical protein
MNYRKIYLEIIKRAKKEQELCIRIRFPKFIVEWSKVIISPNYTKKSIKNPKYRYRYQMDGSGKKVKLLQKLKLNPEWKYYERHHILPKALFPKWIKRRFNIVLLTAREHFFCHQLLKEIYPGKEMTYAMWQLMNCPRKNKDIFFKFSSKYYEKIRIEFSHYMSLRSGIHSPTYGLKRTPEQNKANSERQKDYMLNRGGNKIISKKLKEYFSTEEGKKEMSNRMKTIYQSPELRLKNKLKCKGRHLYTNGIITKMLSECPTGWWLFGNNNKLVSQTKWYNNGIINKRIIEGNIIPEGFISGKLKKQQKWYTNGIKNKMFTLNQQIPKGWYFGKLYTPETKPRKNSKFFQRCS